MRIVCPKCVAQYEVDDSAIPETGREVQCANCDHIWFQDTIDMLPDRPKVEEKSERELFRDLDGVRDNEFHSARAEPDFSDDGEDDDDGGNLLADDDGDDDDDIAAPAATLPPVSDDVRDVLKSEAAFSSARADRDDDDTAVGAQDPDDPDDAIVEIEDDDLAAFLAAHSDDDTQSDTDAVADDAEPASDELSDSGQQDDPLADLAAMRSQLDTAGIEADEGADIVELDDDYGREDDTADGEPDLHPPQSPYTGIVPQDDPLPGAPPVVDDVADDTFDEDDEFDDDEPRPRHAYRADGMTGQDEEVADDDAGHSDSAEDDTDQLGDEAADAIAAIARGLASDPDDHDDEDAFDDDDTDALEEDQTDDTGDTGDAGETTREATPAVAFGMARPRSKGARRARSLPGFGMAKDRDADPVDAPKAKDTGSIGRRPKRLELDDVPEDNEATVDMRGGDRKSLLPDVDEVSDSLRDPPPSARRNRDLLDDDDGQDLVAQGGGFRRAFVWTLFVIALLMALYVMRPQIVAMLPQAAVVLDPYATVIDQLRLMIDGMIG